MKEKNESGLSRRSFLVGASAAVAVAAGAMTGCSAEGDTGKASEESTVKETAETKPSSSGLGEPTQTLQCDFCVVGAGGGCGMAASIEAAESGLSVIGLEKAGATNGAIAYSEGMTAIESKYQKAKGATLTVDEAIHKALDYHHCIPEYDIYENWLSRTAETIDWLEDHGVMFEECVPLGVSLDCWHLYAGDRKVGAGLQFMKDFAVAQQEAGVDLHLNTSGKELIMEDGKVAGVLAVDGDNNVIKIEAKTVLLATGGWSNNKEMVRDLAQVDPESTIASGSIGRDGDGINMAIEVGGKWARGPENIMFYGPILYDSVWGSELQCATSTQPVLWVNQVGKRFTNEELAGANFTHAGNAMRNQKRVFSIQTLGDLMFWQESGPFLSLGVHTPPGVPMPDVMTELQEALDAGNKHIFIADTLEELAEMIEVDLDTFIGTVDAYNSAVDAGKDSMFGKNPEYLRPLKEGPYYAFEVANGYFTTVGGLRVNKDTEVLDATTDEPIPGLYAGGCDAGGLHGDTYDVGILAGSQASWAVNSGRIAADMAAAYLGKA